MNKGMKTYAQLGQVGFEMVVPIIVGAGVDWFFNSWPWLMVIGAVAGFCLGVVHIISFQRSPPPSNTSDEPHGKT